MRDVCKLVFYAIPWSPRAASSWPAARSGGARAPPWPLEAASAAPPAAGSCPGLRPGSPEEEVV